jgi:ATP-binding cassette, subfamily B, bacterial
MSDATSIAAPVPAVAPDLTDVPTLPATLRRRLNGQLEGRQVVAWSEFDLNDSNQYGQHYALLTDRELLIFDAKDADAGIKAQAIELPSIADAKVVEGLGVDRLDVFSGEARAAQLRYTYRHRRSMNRLLRKLERRLPAKEGKEKSPDWLEVVEQRAEVKETCKKCGERIPSHSEGVCPNCLHNRKILWRLMDVAQPYRGQIYLALVLTIVGAAITTVPLTLQKYIINSAISPTLYGAAKTSTLTDAQRISNLLMLAGIFALTVVISEWMGAWRLKILSIMGTRVTADLRHLVYAHLHELSLRYFSKQRTGSLITRVTNDTDRLWDFIVFGSINLIRDVAMIVFIAAVMFWMNWRLAAISLLPLPVLAVLTYRRGMKLQRLFGRLWTYWSRMTAVVGDALPGVRVIKAFASEQREIVRFDERSEEYTAREQETHRVWTSLQAYISILMRLGMLLIWVVGGYMVIRYPDPLHNNLGVLVVFNGFVNMFYQPIMELANSNRMVTRAATSAQRIFEVLDTPPDIFSRTGATTHDHMEGKIEFKHVSFSYEGTAPALREVSLTIEPGKMIGLCGPSGAGKSTFVNLICRFYDVTDGQLLIDGVDVRDYDVSWLRRQVGIVLQEPHLFHGTVADNIRYGNPEATDAEVIAAARAANAHNFIVGFPDGYDTMVGERGQSLSGGERQRISIARAILHNPRILILDEATSSVDTETEKQIQQALDHLVAGRTTIAIANRLRTLESADRLVVLEKGKIVEEGTHNDLVNKDGGVYAKLHQTQMEMASLVAIR